MSLAKRRFHSRRVKRKANRVSTWWAAFKSPKDQGDWVKRNADNLAVCSCRACGNPRRYEGEATRQELASSISECEQMGDIE